MRYILGLSTFGLLLVAGTASAQQPSTSSGASTAPAVQSAPSGGYVPASSGRRFGRWRARNNYNNGPRYMNSQTYRGGNVAAGPSEVRPENAAGQPAAEQISVPPKTETAGNTTQPAVQTSSPTVQQPQSAPSRRFGSRGGLLSRLGSRRGG
jgi:hypothetical protein